jgi:membrane protein
VIRRHARLVWRALNRFFDHNGPDRAAAVAFYTLLSLLPLLTFLIAVGVWLLGSYEAAYRVTLMLFSGIVVHLDERAMDTLREALGAAGRFQIPGLLLLAWTSKRIFTSLFGAMETVFEVPGRGFARGNLVGFGMVLATGFALLLTLAAGMMATGAEAMLEHVAGFAGFERLRGATDSAAARALPMLIAFTFFFLVYRLGPRRRTVSPRHAALGALLATVLWEIAKAGFAYYVKNLAQFGLYGALEAIVVLALWLEISVSIILLCGEFVAELIADGHENGALESGAPADLAKI